MRESIISIPFPLGGLNTSLSLDAQPPGTTPSAVNVRGYDPSSGRDRGGQRSGMTKYVSAQVPTASPIQDINHLTTALSIPKVSAGSFLYFPAGGVKALAVASRLGVLVQTFGAAADQMNVSCWDSSGNGYAALTGGTTGRLVLYKVTAAGVTTWTINHTISASAIQAIGMATDGTYLYIQLYGAAGGFGLPVYRFLVSDGTMVTATYWYKSSVTSYSDLLASNNVVAYGGGVLAIGYGNGKIEMVSTANAILISVVDSTATNQHVDIDSDGGNFFYAAAVDGHTSTIYRYAHNGTRIASAVVGDDITSICFDPVNAVLAASFGSPGPGYGAATYNLSTLATIGTHAISALQWNTIRASGAGGYVLWRNNAANNMIGIDSTMTIATWGPSPLSAAVAAKSAISVNAVPQVPANVAQNSVRALVVAGGSIYRFDRTSFTQLISAALGVGLNPLVPVIFSTPLQQKMYYSDGSLYVVYDSTTDQATLLTATAGSLPIDRYANTGRLLVTWRQRIVISGLAQDASNWFMSAVGDPANWDYAPSPPVETQAVAGNVSVAGKSPDVINCMIPYSDEVLIFGGDHTIYQLTGDPMSGGRIDLVSDAIGIAWGEPWCRDGSGNIYFMSSRGSIYQFAPGSLPQLLSGAINDLLTTTIDFSTTLVTMAWEERAVGFHVWITSTIGPSQPATHYFYDVRNQAWWQDVYANTVHNPLTVHSLQGFTVTDRCVLLGGQDGYIRFIDYTAADDDGTAISTSVTLGPIKDKNASGMTLVDLQANLDSGSSPVFFNVLAGSNAQGALSSSPAFVSTFSAGRNFSKPVRIFGHALYVTIYLNSVAVRWQLEYLRGRVRISDGSARQRIFA